jgi:Interferon-induced transmembrane protein
MNTTAAPGNIPNHLAWAIIATVLATCLCCPLGLLGIVAIVQSNKVNTLINQGDFDGARRASDSAKTWCWVATALAIIGVLINAVFLASGGMGSYMEYMQQMQELHNR